MNDHEVVVREGERGWFEILERWSAGAAWEVTARVWGERRAQRIAVALRCTS